MTSLSWLLKFPSISVRLFTKSKSIYSGVSYLSSGTYYKISDAGREHPGTAQNGRRQIIGLTRDINWVPPGTQVPGTRVLKRNPETGKFITKIYYRTTKNGHSRLASVALTTRWTLVLATPSGDQVSIKADSLSHHTKNDVGCHHYRLAIQC